MGRVDPAADSGRSGLLSLALRGGRRQGPGNYGPAVNDLVHAGPTGPRAIRKPLRREGQAGCRRLACAETSCRVGVTDVLGTVTVSGPAPTLPPGTYRVSELGSEVSSFLGEAFAGVWVGGEVQRPRESRQGHLYFQLVEKGHGDRVEASLDAVLFRTDLARARSRLGRAGVEIADGQILRCSGDVDYYVAGGRLQLIVREVDPVFSLGALAQRRRQVLEGLRASGLLERNRGLELPSLPLRLAVIASARSAGVEDFLATLRASGWGFRLLLLDAAVQGASAEAELVRAIRRLDRSVRSGRANIDAYVLIRGGGARSDLAVFDGQRLAEAIASAERPLLTGLGHEIDESIADRVAHRAFPTPTAVAEYLHQRVSSQDLRVTEVARRLVQAASVRLDTSRHRLDRAGADLSRLSTKAEQARQRVAEVANLLARFARMRLLAAERATQTVESRLAAPAARRVERAHEHCAAVGVRLIETARRRLRTATRELAAASRLTEQLSPERVLRRGFTITQGADGRTIRSVTQVRGGDRLRTQVADGSITSTVAPATGRSIHQDT